MSSYHRGLFPSKRSSIRRCFRLIIDQERSSMLGVATKRIWSRDRLQVRPVGIPHRGAGSVSCVLLPRNWRAKTRDAGGEVLDLNVQARDTQRLSGRNGGFLRQ